MEHTELCMIGFTFMFLLSMVLLTGNLQYQTGTEETYIYGQNYSGYHLDYGPAPGPPSLMPDELNLFHKNTTYVYSTYEDSSGFLTTHRVGYFLALMSVIGFVGCFVGLKPDGFFRRDT